MFTAIVYGWFYHISKPFKGFGNVMMQREYDRVWGLYTQQQTLVIEQDTMEDNRGETGVGRFIMS